jgi:hypothetical protein
MKTGVGVWQSISSEGIVSMMATTFYVCWSQRHAGDGAFFKRWAAPKLAGDAPTTTCGTPAAGFDPVEPLEVAAMLCGLLVLEMAPRKAGCHASSAGRAGQFSSLPVADAGIDGDPLGMLRVLSAT